jgi:hypothetical protein
VIRDPDTEVQALSLIFLSPLGALIALGVLVPLVAAMLVARRADGLRVALGVSRAPRSLLVVPVVAAVWLAVLVGLAAAQPVAEDETTLNVRQDAEVYARSTSAGRCRALRQGRCHAAGRAKDVAVALRLALPGCASVSSLTDRVLPSVRAHEDVRATVDPQSTSAPASRSAS